MDNASNKSLYTLIAIVVFGIFLSLSYFLFQDQMKGVLATVLDKTSQSVDRNLYINLEATSPYFFGTVTNAQGTLTITSYDTSGGKDVIIPSEINGIKVTGIASNAFYNKGLNTLILPNTIKIIEALPDGSNWRGAFSYNNLTELVIPEGVEILGKACFYRNPIEKVTFPSTLKVIELDSFSENRIKEVNFPEGLTTIGGYAFHNNRLTTLTIPNSVTSIDVSAFNGNLITSLTLGTGLTSIGGYAFANNKLTSVTIPESVTSIGINAFVNNPLTSARVPTSTVIQSNTFPATTVITRY